MGALSDADSFQPNLISETPQEVTAKRRALSEQLGEELEPWPYEIALYEEAGLEPPTD